MGFGGGCLPKDVRAFHAVAADLGADGAAHLLAAVDLINQQARTRTIEHVVDLLDNAPAGRVVAVLGTAFKAGSDDIRASPSIDVATALRELGSVVRVYDPAASANTLAAHPELTVCDDMVDAVTGADVVLIGTEWPQFRALTPNWLAAHVAQRQVVDGRNVLDQAKWVASGWRFRAPGRPSDTCPALLTGAC
jgi:UDPglucose 6-dehydrogenase